MNTIRFDTLYDEPPCITYGYSANNEHMLRTRAENSHQSAQKMEKILQLVFKMFLNEMVL